MIFETIVKLENNGFNHAREAGITFKVDGEEFTPESEDTIDVIKSLTKAFTKMGYPVYIEGNFCEETEKELDEIKVLPPCHPGKNFKPTIIIQHQTNDLKCECCGYSAYSIVEIFDQFDVNGSRAVKFSHDEHLGSSQYYTDIATALLQFSTIINMNIQISKIL